MVLGKMAASAISILAAAFIDFASLGALAQTSGSFTQDQVESGRRSYMTNCAQCHSADLSGATAPALVGNTFRSTWNGHTTAELYKFIKSSMPVCLGGSLADRTYSEILAFILSANGARSGTQELDAETNEKIGEIISGADAPTLLKPK
jgi:cytochrome c